MPRFGFKWFVDGLVDGSSRFGGEEQARAFLRKNGRAWTTETAGRHQPQLAAAEIPRSRVKIRGSLSGTRARIRHTVITRASIRPRLPAQKVVAQNAVTGVGQGAGRTLRANSIQRKLTRAPAT